MKRLSLGGQTPRQATQARWAMRRYYKRRSERRCTACGVRLELPAAYCAAHLTRALASNHRNRESQRRAAGKWVRRARQYCRQEGICTICLRTSVTVGYRSCTGCREKRRAQQNLRRSRQTAQGPGSAPGALFSPT